MTDYMLYGLVCTCHPEDGVRYVGMTTVGAGRRLSYHKLDANRKPHLPVNAWKLRHGLGNIRVSPIEHFGSREELAEAEVACIAAYRERGLADLNVLSGGEGWDKGRSHSAETRAKISATIKESYANGRERVGIGAQRRAPIGADERREMSVRAMERWANGALDNRGAKNGSARLTESDVREIRSSYPGVSNRDLARRYGVHVTTMQDVTSGRSWVGV